MYVVNNTTKSDNIDHWKNLQQLKEIQNFIDYQEIKPKGYYLYKEKFGMVAMVKVLEKSAGEDWIGFRLLVKRVLHSPWPVPKGMVFETGYNPQIHRNPNAWHLEPGLAVS